MSKTERVIITGGPGTGKSTLIELLKKRGYSTYPEIARATIKKQLDLGTRLQPWNDLPNFSRIVYRSQLKQFNEAVEGQWNFYDRGMPDVLAYLRREGHNLEELEQPIANYRYHPIVFITPPWPEIYSTDNERREKLQMMNEIHDSIHSTYLSLGYDVREIPKMDPEDRLHFLLNAIGLQ